MDAINSAFGIPGDKGRGIRNTRLAKRLSQQSLASAAGVSRRTLQRVERGGIAYADTVSRIWRVLGSKDAGQREPTETGAGLSIGQWIKDQRRTKRLSLRTASECAGTSGATLSRCERGLGGVRTGGASILTDGLALCLGFESSDDMLREFRHQHKFEEARGPEASASAKDFRPGRVR